MCLAILLFWVVAASDLFRRDLMPDLLLGPPPDFRSVIGDAGDEPTHWLIMVPEARDGNADPRVGEVTTQTSRRRDGSARLTSTAWFDSARMLKGTAFEAAGDSRIEILGACEIDSTGSLDSFRVTVREGMHAKTDLLVLDGHLKNDTIEVVTRSPFPLLSWTSSFPYRARSLVQSTLSPLDRIPNLRVGQRWESRVVSPMTGRVELSTVEVVARRHITWNHNPVATFELVSRMGPLKARTWVRTDGLVLRQEVPFPFVKLLLERQTSDSPGATSGVLR
jgi:hypothetical protein